MFRPATFRFRIALVTLVALAPACDEIQPSSNPGWISQGKAVPEEPSHPIPPSARRSLITYRPLLDETARAELRAGGLFVDFGSADQHKYTRGGWRTGWGAMHERPSTPDGGENQGTKRRLTWTEMSGRRAWLDLPAAAADTVRTVMLRARSSLPDQVLTLYAGAHRLGSLRLGGRWALARTGVAPGALPIGPVRLELRAARTARRGPHAEVDWLWLGSDPAAMTAVPGARVAPRSFAGTLRRTIAAPAPRTYSFYLVPPPGSHFIADLGSAARTTFTVSAAADGAPAVELLRDTVTATWRERAVSLERFAGRPIRLDLRTSDQEGEAGWGEPEIALAKVSPAARAAAAAQGGPPPRNLLFILIDTARADAFGPFARGGNAHTPHYDQLAAESTLFTNAYNNENWTKPSVATILSGLYPSTHDTKRDASKLPGEVELLSQRLEREGFATAAFVANGYISEKFGFDKGWDRFTNYIRENRPSEAEHVYRDAFAWLEREAARRSRKPFFLYIQTIDPHVPYEVDERYWRPFFEGSYRGPLGPRIGADDQVELSKKKIRPDERNLSWLRALYLGEVSYHDQQMGRFLEKVERLGLREETLVVVTADHGEELGERGHFGHGHQMYEDMVRAPLLVSYPPVFPAGARVDEIVEHVDLAPTLLDVLGRGPLPRADGSSFLPLLRGQPLQQPGTAIIEFLDAGRAVRTGSYKLIASAGDLIELYDVGADPDEREDLSSSHPIARRLCEVHLGEALAVPDKAARMTGMGGRVRFRSGNAKIGPAMRRQLEALGYFGSGPHPAAK